MSPPSGQLTRNQIIRKYSAEFHSEKHADLVVSRWQLVLGDLGFFDLHCKKK